MTETHCVLCGRGSSASGGLTQRRRWRVAPAQTFTFTFHPVAPAWRQVPYLRTECVDEVDCHIVRRAERRRRGTTVATEVAIALGILVPLLVAILVTWRSR